MCISRRLGPHRVLVEDVAVLVGADVQTAGEELAVLDGAEGVLKVYLPGADGFDLRAEQLDPGLIAFEDKVFMKGLAVFGDLLDPRLLGHGSHILPALVSLVL